MDEQQDVPFDEPVDTFDDSDVSDDVVDEVPDEAAAPVPVPAAQSGGLEPTGNSEVDDVLESVGQVADLETAEHVEIYEDAHRRLHETLVTAVDEQERPHGR
ncbi:hypothetical protein [Tenggerimyces flavus]|uniref:Uncharacterized protein n=1 Tax=Tenggerimyces flavus TaxID=1708749 RepID=A0ABV7YMU5_9ACTN|nr:hypothetical protein [Tenggerimyces flavus]MBM7787451.1 hypothetical protein [Tenggerimyces flavus]